MLIDRTIERMAADLDLPADELELRSVDRVEWADGCLGRAHGVPPCPFAEPESGLRVVFAHEETGLHEAHTDHESRIIWVGRSSAYGDFVGYEAQLAIVTIDGRDRAFRLVRGTQVHGVAGVPELAIPAPGQRVWVNFDPAPGGLPALLERMIVVGP